MGLKNVRKTKKIIFFLISVSKCVELNSESESCWILGLDQTLDQKSQNSKKNWVQILLNIAIIFNEKLI